MKRSILIAIFACARAWGEPFLPASDAQVLERLPYKAGDPVVAQLRAERAQLSKQPDDLHLALRLASRYIELGRINGDPRYAGYAQAALSPLGEPGATAEGSSTPARHPAPACP